MPVLLAVLSVLTGLTSGGGRVRIFSSRVEVEVEVEVRAGTSTVVVVVVVALEGRMADLGE